MKFILALTLIHSRDAILGSRVTKTMFNRQSSSPPNSETSYNSRPNRDDKIAIIDEINKGNWENIQQASPELKADKDVAYAAVKKNYKAIQFISEALKQDDDILKLVPPDGYEWTLENNIGKHSKKFILRASQKMEPKYYMP